MARSGSLYRSGHLQARTRIASDISTGAAKAVNPQELSAHQGLIQDFLYWEPVVPGTAQGLAEFLAPMARILRDEVLNALDRGNTPLRLLAHEWGGLLFPEADAGQFADAYAQTVTYALLLARFEGAESLRPARAVDILQREHGLLAEALQLLEAPPVRQELNMPIELLERAIGAVDSDKISLGGDPWLYFYEQFLGAYDPKLRKDRGVYYTPVQVVQAQVNLAGELLRTRFGKQLAYAEEEVVVLDPAVGTGTYPLGSPGPRVGDGAEPTGARSCRRKATQPGSPTLRFRKFSSDPISVGSLASVTKSQGRRRTSCDAQGVSHGYTGVSQSTARNSLPACSRPSLPKNEHVPKQ